MSRVDDLLAAPRGRALCSALERTGDVFESLGEAVTFAVYWQEPLDPEDVDRPDEQLRPVADRLLRSADIGWWRAAAVPEQWHLDRLSGQEKPGRPGLDAGPALGRWYEEQRRARHSPEHLAWDDVSGTWWSTPTASGGPPATTRALPGRGPVGLWLVEDELGWSRARCWPVAAARDPRIFEVHGPDDWAQLARTYPFDVTDSRGPDWKRATGRTGKWVIPDWPAVAADYDAVHVSAWGWLTTAGRPVPVNGAASLLAGWSPDETYWLTDCLAVNGAPVDYARDEDGDWRPVT